jgi:hypothetical protein
MEPVAVRRFLRSLLAPRLRSRTFHSVTKSRSVAACPVILFNWCQISVAVRATVTRIWVFQSNYFKKRLPSHRPRSNQNYLEDAYELAEIANENDRSTGSPVGRFLAVTNVNRDSLSDFA